MGSTVGRDKQVVLSSWWAPIINSWLARKIMLGTALHSIFDRPVFRLAGPGMSLGVGTLDYISRENFQRNVTGRF